MRKESRESASDAPLQGAAFHIYPLVIIRFVSSFIGYTHLGRRM